MQTRAIASPNDIVVNPWTRMMGTGAGRVAAHRNLLTPARVVYNSCMNDDESGAIASDINQSDC